MKKVILIITGSIAAPKAVDLYYLLAKSYIVTVLLTPSAKKFVKFPSDITINESYLEQDFYLKSDDIKHVDLALDNDLIIVYPATMNFISKAALAICDNLALSTFLASNKPKIIFPAMNHNMYHNQGLQNNLQILKQDFSIKVVEPDKGLLACNIFGDGRVKEHDVAFKLINDYFKQSSEMIDKTVLINFGAARVYLDDIRYITNNSSGKMGLEVVKAFLARKAKVIAIVGDVKIPLIKDENLTVIRANTNQKICQASKLYFDQADVAIFAAALNDYQLTQKWKGKIDKIKNPQLQLNLVPNIDLLKSLSARKENQLIIGFSAQDNEDWNIAKNKMINKKCDGIIVNHINTMNQDDTKIKFYLKDDSYHFSGSKIDVAQEVVNIISKVLNK